MTRPYHASSRRSSGFTLLEVMMALTVLAIGMLGMVALQTSTVTATQQANQFAIANSIARTWVSRLQRDAQRWNHPSKYVASSDLTTDTVWLARATDTAGWFRPVISATLEPLSSPGFDMYGNDLPAASMANAVYCTHLRLRQLYPNSMIQAEVRVFWRKRKIANPTLYATLSIPAGGFCDPAVDPAVVGRDDANFHWTYSVTGINQTRAE